MSTLPEDRRRAIAQSGWGAEFRLYQPHNLAFWVYCLLVVAGAIVLSGQVSIALAAYSGALVSGIIVFGMLAAAYLGFIRHSDRYTTVPPKLAGAGFVWGFVAATGAFALVANDALISLYAKGFGASFATDWGAALAAPINEEVAKGAGILLLLTLAPRLIRSPFDGLILGAFVGIGFQINEDISYAWIGSANSFGDIGAAWQTIVARMIASLTSHWAFSAIFGAGLIWLIGRPDAPARKWLGAGLMVTAILTHGLWNASSAIGGDTALGWIVPIIVAVVLISVLIWVYTTASPSSASGCGRSWPPRSSAASSRRRSSRRLPVRARRSETTSARSRIAAARSTCSTPRRISRIGSRTTMVPTRPRFSRRVQPWPRRAASEGRPASAPGIGAVRDRVEIAGREALVPEGV